MKKFILLGAMSLVLVACGDGKDKPVAPTAKAMQEAAVQTVAVQGTIMLLYAVSEPGIEPYQSRIIVNDDFIRLDENKDDNNFVLVDRKDKIVYSVAEDNTSILVVKQRPVTIASPVVLNLSFDKNTDKAAPKIDGHVVSLYVFKVNDKACNEATIADSLLPRATKALSEYRIILAGQHASTLGSTPADLRNACDMASHIFHPARHLQYGLPVQEWDLQTGYRRSLVDFDDDWQAKPELFILPKEFERFSIDSMQNPTPTIADQS